MRNPLPIMRGRTDKKEVRRDERVMKWGRNKRAGT